MLADIYIIYSLITFFLFFVGLTNIIKLVRGTRMTIMFITFILFLYLSISSFNIEVMFCGLDSSSQWQCKVSSMNDLPLSIFNIMLAILSMLYILVESFGWMPKEISAKSEET